MEDILTALASRLKQKDNSANKGTNGTGRIVIYRYSEEVVRGIMGMDLTRGATVFSGEKQATLTSYVAFVGEPQFVKPSAIIYYDNKA